jgi:cyclin-dependent kinase 10
MPPPQPTQQNQALITGNLLSFTGKTCQIDTRQCLGTCRSVDSFEKLNRIGEGTYGIV